ncbi:MAG: hypothetical protein FWF31_02945 [Desulfobulbus sp.]|nr:hypothetical protein [Desulfobulbus sp.]
MLNSYITVMAHAVSGMITRDTLTTFAVALGFVLLGAQAGSTLSGRSKPPDLPAHRLSAADRTGRGDAGPVAATTLSGSIGGPITFQPGAQQDHCSSNASLILAASSLNANGL